MGRELRGIYHLPEDRIYVYTAGERGRVAKTAPSTPWGAVRHATFLGDQAPAFREEMEW